MKKEEAIQFLTDAGFDLKLTKDGELSAATLVALAKAVQQKETLSQEKNELTSQLEVLQEAQAIASEELEKTKASKEIGRPVVKLDGELYQLISSKFHHNRVQVTADDVIASAEGDQVLAKQLIGSMLIKIEE